jgi:hypothetical protein
MTLLALTATLALALSFGPVQSHRATVYSGTCATLTQHAASSARQALAELRGTREPTDSKPRPSGSRVSAIPTRPNARCVKRGSDERRPQHDPRSNFDPVSKRTE